MTLAQVEEVYAKWLGDHDPVPASASSYEAHSARLALITSGPAGVSVDSNAASLQAALPRNARPAAGGPAIHARPR